MTFPASSVQSGAGTFPAADVFRHLSANVTPQARV